MLTGEHGVLGDQVNEFYDVNNHIFGGSKVNYCDLFKLHF